MKAMLMLLCLVCSLSFSASGQSLKKVRQLFQEAPESERACSELQRILRSATADEEPLLYGYKGVATMIMANHLVNPLRKLSHFKEGKNILEKAIRKEPSNAELRFLRLGVQTEAPGFLNYNQDIRSDRSFVEQALVHTKDEELKQMISKFLKAK